jgi:hypothetical protein
LEERDRHEPHQAGFAHATPDVKSERSFAGP